MKNFSSEFENKSTVISTKKCLNCYENKKITQSSYLIIKNSLKKSKIIKKMFAIWKIICYNMSVNKIRSFSQKGKEQNVGY